MDLTQFPFLLRILAYVRKARDATRRLDSKLRKAKSHRSSFYSHVWREAAGQLDLETIELEKGTLEFRTTDNLSFRTRANYTPLDSTEALEKAGNKSLVHQLLSENGLPTPDFRSFQLGSIGIARDFIQKSENPCVVKPSSGTGAGQGITTGIRRLGQLAWAASVAHRYHSDLIIEQEIRGDNYRLLFLDGELLDVIKRNPPSIVGDGQSSIKSLIQQENHRRLQGWDKAQTLIRHDRDMQHSLSSQGFTLRSILPMGTRIPVKTVINDNSADENEDFNGRFCAEVIDAARLAASLLNVRLAGIDVITSDPSVPLKESGGVILEVNTTPGLYHHKRGHSCPVALRIMQAMVQQARTSARRPSPSIEENRKEFRSGSAGSSRNQALSECPPNR